MTNVLKTCTVCADNLDTDKFKKITSACSHDSTICVACVTSHIMNIVNGGSFSIASYSNMACPSFKCSGLLGGNDMKTFLTKEQFDRWDRLAFQEWAEAQSDFRWCSANDCGSGQLVYAEDNNFFICEKCKAITCIQHKVPFHRGQSCDEYDKTLAVDEQALQNWKAQHSKPCPKCKVSIEKDGGCDHMTCNRCKHEFCWSCLAEFEPIRRNGNHHHKPTCRFYAAYNGAD